MLIFSAFWSPCWENVNYYYYSTVAGEVTKDEFYEAVISRPHRRKTQDADGGVIITYTPDNRSERGI